MKPLDEEFSEAQELVRSAPLGHEVLQSLPIVSESLAKKAESGLSGFAAQFVMSLLGRQGVTQAIHKNCVFVLARLLTRARAYDGATPQERVKPLIHLLSVIAPQAKRWAACHEASAHPIHDKKERARRRRLVLHEEKANVSQATHALLEALWHNLIPILLPCGASSLYLPAGGSFLLSHIDKEIKNPSFIFSSPEWAEKTVRELKTSVMYWILNSVKQHLGNEKDSIPRYTIPPDLIASILPIIEPVRTAFMLTDLPQTQDDPLPPEAIASSVVRFLLFFVQSFSAEAALTSGWLNMVASSESVVHTEQELEELIETVSRDDRLIKKILHLVAPTIDIGPSTSKNLSFWGIVMDGLTSALTDVFIEDTLGSFDWEGAQRTVLDRLRWFFFSPYADEAFSQLLLDP